MAGGVSRGLGGALCVVGVVLLVLGLVLLVRGATTLDAESRETLPDRDGAQDGAATGTVGLVAVGLGLVVLFVGVPLLVWGLHREQDGLTGKARTRRGGALVAWAACFILLGAILLAIGAIMTSYGGAIARSSGSPYLGSSREEAGLGLAALGSAASVVGIGGLLSGMVLGGVAWGRARSEGGALFAQTPGVRAFAAAGGLLVVGLLTFAVFGAGPAATALDTLAEERTITESWEGQIRAVGTPLGPVGQGGEAVHTMARPANVPRALVVATAYWAGVNGAPPAELVLVVEVAGAGGAWEEVDRQRGASGLSAGTSSTPVPLTGDVRARLIVPEGEAAGVDYVLEIDLRPVD